MEKLKIKVEVLVNAPLNKVWKGWTDPASITKWNFASDDWCCPNAVNDLRPGGKLNWRMEAKDGSFGFDFEGTYEQVIPEKEIQYSIVDGRKVNVHFLQEEDSIRVTEEFETEDENSAEMQRNGWQAILENFKLHVESSLI